KASSRMLLLPGQSSKGYARRAGRFPGSRLQPLGDAQAGDRPSGRHAWSRPGRAAQMRGGVRCSREYLLQPFHHQAVQGTAYGVKHIGGNACEVVDLPVVAVTLLADV